MSVPGPGAARQFWHDNGPEMLLVALCCLAAFLGAAWVSSSVFERLPHTEDESAFLFQAQTVASGRLVADAPELPRAFSIPFIIVRDGMWFGKYPPGYPVVLATGVLVGQPWLVNATFAALCVLLIYLLARRLYGFPMAILSAALLTVSPFFLLQAGSLLSHVVSLFWTLLFVLLYTLARSRQGWLIPLSAGAALGVLFMTRPLTAVGVALPFVLWTLVSIARERRINRSYLLMLAAVLPFIAAYLAYNDYTTGSPFRTAYELWWSFDHIGFGPEVGINGHDLSDGIRNTRINSNSLASYLFGWPGRFSLVPALAVVTASLGSVVLRAYQHARGSLRSPAGSSLSPERWDLMLAGVVVGVMLVHVFYWTPGQMYGPRYFMEAIGPLVILTARCVDRLALALSVFLAALLLRVRESTAAAYSLAGVVLLGLTMYAHLSWAPQEFDRFRGWNEITGYDLAIVEAYDLSNAVVLVQRDSWTDYAPFFTRNTPSLDSDVVYASDRGPVENQLLMSAYPGRSFYLFADGRLEQIHP